MQLNILYSRQSSEAYGSVALQHTPIESSWYNGYCDIIVSKEEQMVAGNYLKNVRLLGQGCCVV